MELKEYFEQILNQEKEKNKTVEAFMEKYSSMEPAKYWSLPSKDANKKNKIIKKIEDNAYISTPKVDGEWHKFIFGNDNTYKAQTRNISRVTGDYGNKTNFLPHVWNEMVMSNMPEQTVLLAEVYYPNKKSNDVGKIMRCKVQKALDRQNGEYGKLHIYIFDVLSINGVSLEDVSYIKRIYLLKMLGQIHFKNSEYIKTAEPTYVPDYTTALKIMGKALQNNYEGLVLNKKDEIYRPGKRKAWSSIKFKPEITVDAIVTNVLPSTKYYEGTEIDGWKYWINEITEEKEFGNCKGVPNMKPITKYYYNGWPSAIEFGFFNNKEKKIYISGSVSSGLNDEQLSELVNKDSFIMKPIELSCMEITEDNRLRHPIFIRFREDINIEDCNIEKLS